MGRTDAAPLSPRSVGSPRPRLHARLYATADCSMKAFSSNNLALNMSVKAAQLSCLSLSKMTLQKPMVECLLILNFLPLFLPVLQQALLYETQVAAACDRDKRRRRGQR